MYRKVFKEKITFDQTHFNKPILDFISRQKIFKDLKAI